MNELTKETSVYFDLQRLMHEKDDQLADYHIEIVCEILASNLDKVKEIVNQWVKHSCDNRRRIHNNDKPYIPIHHLNNNNLYSLDVPWLRQDYLPTDLGTYPKR